MFLLSILLATAVVDLNVDTEEATALYEDYEEVELQEIVFDDSLYGEDLLEE